MGKRTNSVTVSISTRTSVTQYGSSCFSEVALPICNTKQEKIPRLYPVFAIDTDDGCNVLRKCPSSTDTPSKTPVFTTTTASKNVTPVKLDKNLKTICKAAVHSDVQEFVVKWKGLTPKQIDGNLIPFKIHYQLQLVVLEERRNRRMVANEEFTGRLELYIKCRYTSPLREKLLNCGELNAISDRMHAMYFRKRHSPSVTSMSLTRFQSLKDDPLHTPSTCFPSNDLTPWTGDSQITYTLKSDNESPSRTFVPLMGTIKHERPHKETNDDLLDDSKTEDESKGTSLNDTPGKETVMTVTRCLNTSGITGQSPVSDTSANKKECDTDSLARSLMGSSIGSDDDSLANPLTIEMPVVDDGDDSLSRSLLNETTAGFLTPIEDIDDDEKEKETEKEK
ncbi:uncharacterized protein TM35_000172010 [Trypanosoma theileri]|uniref:Uncharacterized protein n=1 Tax=Trypanosoma theileri TaxID=67003 RepID=A0A1X0NVU3_9TRYP|nr:uncharacterized protein TM35_000172010 [Trypanosoma theileri]ORC88329.1 hypothetical protein TM35_000172010 [Trypanosoma theileri]